MEAMARGGKLPRLGSAGEGVAEPQLLYEPPPECDFTPPLASAAMGRRVQLIHPWSLGDDASDAADSSSSVLTIAAFPAELSARWPWSPARWQFVAQAMAARTPHLLLQALSGADSVQGTSNLHLPADWQALGLRPPTPFAATPPRRCHSFSQYWNAVAGKLGSVEELLGSAGGQSGARGRS
jgi:deoxyribodipyrimidine photo-lyase